MENFNIPFDNTIYTIGYTSYNIDDFFTVLLKNNIDCVIDVRSYPYSSHFKDFNKEYLSSKLDLIGKHYRNYAKEFGARQEYKKFLSKDGYLDFEKFTQSEQFCNGVLKLKDSCDKNYRIVLMCAEKDPISCHRCIMIGRVLNESGFSVQHILSNNEIESHTVSENRLVEEFCKKHKIMRNQNSILPDAMENLSSEQLLKLAYREKNVEIGYRQEMCDCD